MVEYISTELHSQSFISLGSDNEGLAVVDLALQFKGRYVICTGIDRCEETAFAKARSEVAERVAFFKAPTLTSGWKIKGGKIYAVGTLNHQQRLIDIANLSWMRSINGSGRLTESHGFAAHTSVEGARRNSKREILERYFSMILKRNSNYLEEYSSFSEDECVEKVWVAFLDTHSVWYGLCKYSNSGTGGWGASCHENRHDAITRAMQEACGMAHSYAIFGLRGNAVSALRHMEDYCLRKVATVDHETIVVDGSTRYVSQAVIL